MPFSPHILAMSSSSEALLDHIADYLLFISNAQSYWFTLNASYDHGCHIGGPQVMFPARFFGIEKKLGRSSTSSVTFLVRTRTSNLPPPPSQRCSTLPPHLHARSLARRGNQLKGQRYGIPPPQGSAVTSADF